MKKSTTIQQHLDTLRIVDERHFMAKVVPWLSSAHQSTPPRLGTRVRIQKNGSFELHTSGKILLIWSTQLQRYHAGSVVTVFPHTLRGQKGVIVAHAKKKIWMFRVFDSRERRFWGEGRSRGRKIRTYAVKLPPSREVRIAGVDLLFSYRYQIQNPIIISLGKGGRICRIDDIFSYRGNSPTLIPIYRNGGPSQILIGAGISSRQIRRVSGEIEISVRQEASSGLTYLPIGRHKYFLRRCDRAILNAKAGDTVTLVLEQGWPVAVCGKNGKTVAYRIVRTPDRTICGSSIRRVSARALPPVAIVDKTMVIQRRARGKELYIQVGCVRTWLPPHIARLVRKKDIAFTVIVFARRRIIYATQAAILNPIEYRLAVRLSELINILSSSKCCDRGVWNYIRDIIIWATERERQEQISRIGFYLLVLALRREMACLWKDLSPEDPARRAARMARTILDHAFSKMQST